MRTRQNTTNQQPPQRQPQKVRFRLEKETPGAVRYMEVDEFGNKKATDAEGAALCNLYLRKAFMRRWLGSDKGPTTLFITVSTTADPALAETGLAETGLAETA